VLNEVEDTKISNGPYLFADNNTKALLASSFCFPRLPICPSKMFPEVSQTHFGATHYTLWVHFGSEYLLPIRGPTKICVCITEPQSV
jgi:hypothetical protein